MGRALSAFLITLVAGGCGEGAPDSSRPGSSRQMGDTTFVFSSAPLRGTASLREVSRIGMIDGPPEYLLGMFPTFTMGPDGSFVVADGGDLRLYESSGAYVRMIARQGQGPGEVRALTGMDVSVDELLAVLDLGNRRVSVFSLDGNLIREIRLDPAAGRPGYGRDAIQWDDEGELWIALNPPRSGPDTLGREQRRPLFGRLVDHEEVADTVFLSTRAWEGCQRRLPIFAAGFMEDSRLWHMPFAQWSRGRTGSLAFGCSARYAIDVVRLDGGVTRISREWEPPVRTDDEHEYWSESARRTIAQTRSLNQTLAAAGRGDLVRPIPPVSAFPRERPAFFRLWHADDGRLWVWPGATGSSRPTTEEERRRQPGLQRRIWEYWNPTDGFDVFDAAGRWVGHVSTPESWDADPYPGIIDPYFRGDTIWAVVKEEFDVRYMVRFEVEWPSPD